MSETDLNDSSTSSEDSLSPELEDMIDD